MTIKSIKGDFFFKFHSFEIDKNCDEKLYNWILRDAGAFKKSCCIGVEFKMIFQWRYLQGFRVILNPGKVKEELGVGLKKKNIDRFSLKKNCSCCGGKHMK